MTGIPFVQIAVGITETTMCVRMQGGGQGLDATLTMPDTADATQKLADTFAIAGKSFLGQYEALSGQALPPLRVFVRNRGVDVTDMVLLLWPGAERDPEPLDV